MYLNKRKHINQKVDELNDKKGQALSGAMRFGGDLTTYHFSLLRQIRAFDILQNLRDSSIYTKQVNTLNKLTS